MSHLSPAGAATCGDAGPVTRLTFRKLEHPGAAFGEFVGDDEALDLGGAFPDAVDAEFAVEAFDGVGAVVAASAVDLQASVDDAAGCFGGGEFGDGCFGVQG